MSALWIAAMLIVPVLVGLVLWCWGYVVGYDEGEADGRHSVLRDILNDEQHHPGSFT